VLAAQAREHERVELLDVDDRLLGCGRRDNRQNARIRVRGPQRSSVDAIQRRIFRESAAPSALRMPDLRLGLVLPTLR
jgi:hypothetical protein